MHMLSFKDGSNPFEFIETIQLLTISYVLRDRCLSHGQFLFLLSFFFMYSLKGILWDAEVILFIGFFHKDDY